MNGSKMKNDQKDMEVMKMFGEEMRAHMKQEQFEKAKNFKYLNPNAVKGQILFTGSSLMEQFPIAEIARNNGIEKLIYNRGIGGYTTDDFIAEIDAVLFDLLPAKIFINIGTNDMNEREDGEDWNQHLMTNYEYILNQIKERLPEADIYLMSYYPVNKTVIDNPFMAEMLKIRTNENIHMVNQQMQELARRFNYHYIDVNDGLCDDAGNLKAEFTKEGLHMFANAYEVVFHNLKNYL